MILAEKTYKRPNANVLWHFDVVTTGREEFIAQLATYNDEILLNTRDVVDENTIVFRTLFLNQEVYDRYKVDPILNVFWSARDEYNQSVGIYYEPTIVTEL